MFGYLEAVPSAILPSEIGNSNSGHERLTAILQDPESIAGVVEQFIILAKETQQIPVVFEMAAVEQTVPPFLRRVLWTLLVSEDVSKPIELVKARWFLIREVLLKDKKGPESLEGFLKEWRSLDGLVANVLNGTFDVDESGLYVALLRSTEDANIVDWAANGVSIVDGETWTRRIGAQEPLVELVVELKGARGQDEVRICLLGCPG